MKIKTYLKSPELYKPIAISCLIAIGITLFVIFSIGQIYASEAKDLLESIQKTCLYYGSAVATSSATILALTLTILSLAGSHDEQKPETYTRLQAIAQFCVLSFIGAIMLLLVVSFPVLELETIPSSWFRYVYYGVCIWNGLLAAAMISTILMLKDTTAFVIGVLSPSFDEKGDKTDKDAD